MVVSPLNIRNIILIVKPFLGEFIIHGPGRNAEGGLTDRLSTS